MNADAPQRLVTPPAPDTATTSRDLPVGPDALAAGVDGFGLPTGPVALFAVLVLDENPLDAASGALAPHAYDAAPARFRPALVALCDDWFDRARCARCGTPVGYVTGDGIEPDRWIFTSLVDGLPRTLPDESERHPVSWQCEDCAPDTAPEPWPADREPSVWWPRDLTECATEPGGARTVHVTPVGATACRCGQTEPRRAPSVAGEGG